MTTRELGVGLLGFGTIGTGVVRVLLDNADLIAERTGVRPVLRWVADPDTERDRGVDLGAVPLLPDARDRLADEDLDVVVELIGGTEPARSLVLAAIESGKHVVTANKALLSTGGPELFAAARARGVTIGFEASVGGGIPILRSLAEGFVGNRIRSVHGIINGTANYILSEMTGALEAGRETAFDAVLAEAQRLGYAEADPTYDVDGIDTAHKLVLLIRLAFGRWIALDDLYTEGIRRIDALDVAYARDFGCRIKLLATAKEVAAGIQARVHPVLVPAGHLLADVGGNFNAITVVGDAVGPTLHYGQGAGMMPTASAVVGDLLDVVRGGGPAMGLADAPRDRPVPIDDLVVPYYLRFSVLDEPGVLSALSGELGARGISIASVTQPEQRLGESVPIVMRTHQAREGDVREALAAVERLSFVRDATHLIRFEPDLEGDA